MRRYGGFVGVAAVVAALAGCGDDGGGGPSASFGEPQVVGDMTVTLFAPMGRAGLGGNQVWVQADLVAADGASGDVTVPIPELECDDGAQPPLDLSPSNFSPSLSPGSDDTGDFVWTIEGCGSGSVVLAGTRYEFTELLPFE